VTPDPPHPHARLEDAWRRAEAAGGPERIRRQREAGKLTARERVALLFDPGTFTEIDALVTHRCQDFGMADQVVPGDGVMWSRVRWVNTYPSRHHHRISKQNSFSSS
jgi:propionyl-CoA carboxylase beta chain